MRDELIRAAKAHPGDVSDLILKAARSIKVRSFGGWSVDRVNKRKGNGRRNR